MITEDEGELWTLLRESGLGRGLRRLRPGRYNVIPSRDALFIQTLNGDGWNSDDPRDFLPEALRHEPHIRD